MVRMVLKDYGVDLILRAQNTRRGYPTFCNKKKKKK